MNPVAASGDPAEELVQRPQGAAHADEPLRLTMSGGEHAPGLSRYLEAQGVLLHRANLSENEARAAVRGTCATHGR